jgi:hypothetical protein
VASALIVLGMRYWVLHPSLLALPAEVPKAIPAAILQTVITGVILPWGVACFIVIALVYFGVVGWFDAGFVGVSRVLLFASTTALPTATILLLVFWALRPRGGLVATCALLLTAWMFGSWMFGPPPPPSLIAVRPVQQPSSYPRVALALSGGGYRAAVFHAGVVSA